VTTHSPPEDDRAFTRPIEPDEHEKPDQVEPESDPVPRQRIDDEGNVYGPDGARIGQTIDAYAADPPERKAASIRWKPPVPAFPAVDCDEEHDDPFFADPYEDQHD